MSSGFRAAFAVCAVLVGLPAAASAPESVESAAHDAATRARTERAVLEKLGQRETSILDTLDAMERRGRELERTSQAADADLAAATARVDALDARLAEHRAQFADRRAALGVRLRALRGLTAPARFALLVDAGGRDRAALARVRLGLSRVTEADVDTLADYRTAIAALDSDRAAADTARAEQATRADAARAERDKLRAARHEQSVALDGVHKQRALHEKLATELEAVEHELQRKLVAVAASRPAPAAGAAFSKLRGHLPRPTPGGVSAGFGTQRDPVSGARVEHRGVDIAAPAGAPVRAVHAGTVAFVGWMRGLGQLVILDHGGEGATRYHTLCAHLAEAHVTQGEAVAEGAVIGTVGDTGSLTGPHLYFEVRVSGRPVDPQDWLEAPR